MFTRWLHGASLVERFYYSYQINHLFRILISSALHFVPPSVIKHWVQIRAKFLTALPQLRFTFKKEILAFKFPPFLHLNMSRIRLSLLLLITLPPFALSPSTPQFPGSGRLPPGRRRPPHGPP